MDSIVARSTECRPALLPNELLLHIFGYLMAHKQYLAHAAWTCRAWSQPVHDILWQDLGMEALVSASKLENVSTLSAALLVSNADLVSC